MSVIPFSWPLDLEVSRVRTLFGGGNDPVLPYEPPSTVIKVSKLQLGIVQGTRWILQFENTKVYDRSYYGQQENTSLILSRDNCDEKVSTQGTIALFDLGSHKLLTSTDFDRELDVEQKNVSLMLDLPWADLSYAIFENSKLCIQGNVTISHFWGDNSDKIDTAGQSSAVETHIIKRNPLLELADDLSSLLKDGTFSDFTIKCGTSAYSTHKSIMSARSKVFTAMLQSDLTERIDNELVIEDLEPEIVEKMLEFMYSSQVKDLNFTVACDLLYAADKYELAGLIVICVEYLKSILSTENALQLLTIADLYDEGMKSFVIDYIASYFDYFEDKEEWLELREKKGNLTIEVLEHVVRLLRKRSRSPLISPQEEDNQI